MSSQPGQELLAALSDELDRLSAELLTGFHDRGSSAVAERRRVLQERIRFLGSLIAGLRDVEPGHLARNRVGLGSVVRARDLESKEASAFTVVSFDLADGSPEKVTPASPIGQAIMGARAGDVVEIETPARVRRVRIEHVLTIWDALDRWNGESRELRSA